MKWAGQIKCYVVLSIANAVADMSVIKRHGAWKSSNVAEGYVDDSLENKNKICKLLVGGEDQENTLHIKKKHQNDVNK
jgi:hypothetical protein